MQALWVVGMFVGGYLGFRSARKHIWIGTPKGIFGRYLSYVMVGMFVGSMVAAGASYFLFGFPDMKGGTGTAQSIRDAGSAYTAGAFQDEDDGDAVPYQVDTGTAPYYEEGIYEEDDGGYTLDRVYITEEDLEGWSARDLSILRNSIYAYHGYVFRSSEYNEYFSQFGWYYPNADFKESDLNEIEKRNAEFIQQYQDVHGLNYTPH